MNPLSGYAACKSVVVTHTDDGTQTNYQMKLTIVKGDGVDAAGTTYLDNKALNWPYDVRFTKADGTTLLDFWREEYDATDGTWWIEVDSIPDPTNATIYLHVGDADAVDASNGANTFIFFNHFDVNDFTGYTTAGAPTIASSILTVKCRSAVNESVVYNTAFPVNRALRMRLKAVHANDPTYSEQLYVLRGGYGGGAHYSNPSYNYYYTGYETGGPEQVLITGIVADTYFIQDMIRNSSTSQIFLVNDGDQKSLVTQVLSGNGQVGWYSTVKDNAEMDIDWWLLRLYTTNEPTWGAWGDWETGGTVKRSVPRIARIMVMSP